MKQFFFKRKRELIPQTNRVTKGTKKRFEQLKRYSANWMNDHTKSFTRQTWIVLLLLFITSAGSISIYIMINSFREHETNLIVITPIRKPNHILETGEANIGTRRLPAKEYNLMIDIRYYMDSLIKRQSGKIVYDSIITLHPGLMDSLRFIENYFQQLNEKKWKSE